MVIPHVARVAGLLRMYFPDCKAFHIRYTMNVTAKDKRNTGYDNQKEDVQNFYAMRTWIVMMVIQILQMVIKVVLFSLHMHQMLHVMMGMLVPLTPVRMVCTPVCWIV